MKSALIGYTGFVGSNLQTQYSFEYLYNSKNFQDMKGQDYDLVVCAGVSAVKWQANKEPEKDIENIRSLENVLATITAKHFILISTIDVYPVTRDQNEDYNCMDIENHPYGTNRLAFEKFCDAQFDNCTIVRLPGLFGKSLKKNVIFDLLNDNCLEMINSNSSIQYYDLRNLWYDINLAVDNNIKLINLFTEPLTTKDIHGAFFSTKKIGAKPVPAVYYSLQTKFSSFWGNDRGYIYEKEQVMNQLSEFINSYQRVSDETSRL